MHVDWTRGPGPCRNALKASEIIFACGESARRRGTVELPLDVDGNPLVALVESGELKAARQEE